MQIEQVSYGEDGTLKGTLYGAGGSDKRPGLIVFPDIFGLGDHARGRAHRLAGLGYVVLAAELHGDGRMLAFEQAMDEFASFNANPALPCGRGQAAWRFLHDTAGVDADRIGAVGFCYGGALAFELARLGMPLAAAIGFHATLGTSNPDGASKVTAKILACIGSEDPIVPAEQRAAFEREMRAADVDWQLHLYGGVYHSFTDRRSDGAGQPEVTRYSPSADRRSWAAMVALLDEVFGDHSLAR